jgi:[acyl-carrier-protein] S-malonyltransferase
MPRVALLFPGQGAQTVGMGREVLAHSAEARRLFAEAQAILGYDLADVCLNGPAERLNSTVVSQPAIFVGSLAALEVLRATEPAVLDACVATAGLSLGEYTALVFAGVLPFAEGLRLVQRRGEAMQEASDATPSGMVSILMLERPAVEEIVQEASTEGFIRIANWLCPGNIVVSGERRAVAKAQQLAEARGARTVMLSVAGAFHTPLMKPADERLAQALSEVPLQPARIPVWSNVDAQPHQDPTEIRSLLIRQVLEPVLWEESVRRMLEAGVEQFYEVGPGKVLAGLLKRIQRKAECRHCPF